MNSSLLFCLLLLNFGLTLAAHGNENMQLCSSFSGDGLALGQWLAFCGQWPPLGLQQSQQSLVAQQSLKIPIGGHMTQQLGTQMGQNFLGTQQSLRAQLSPGAQQALGSQLTQQSLRTQLGLGAQQALGTQLGLGSQMSWQDNSLTSLENMSPIDFDTPIYIDGSEDPSLNKWAKTLPTTKSPSGQSLKQTSFRQLSRNLFGVQPSELLPVFVKLPSGGGGLKSQGEVFQMQQSIPSAALRSGSQLVPQISNQMALSQTGLSHVGLSQGLFQKSLPSFQNDLSSYEIPGLFLDKPLGSMSENVLWQLSASDFTNQFPYLPIDDATFNSLETPTSFQNVPSKAPVKTPAKVPGKDAYKSPQRAPPHSETKSDFKATPPPTPPPNPPPTPQPTLSTNHRQNHHNSPNNWKPIPGPRRPPTPPRRPPQQNQNNAFRKQQMYNGGSNAHQMYKLANEAESKHDISFLGPSLNFYFLPVFERVW